MSSWSSFVRRAALVALGLALASPPAAAQQADNAIVVGTVLDESGAPIPGAPVVVTHVATGVSTAGRDQPPRAIPHAAAAHRRL